ncbi:hypothetical protein TIFTF001_003679 [Ficus carica]|uniref:Uncharacterized protein n=1 Tax=Ficus carica TaxID=3494 RepID=A0AA88CWF2_FICCA|nr:hypothetical protein TIFTF001_003679 [Ficus carica]
MTVVPVGFCDNGEVIVRSLGLKFERDCGQECHFPLLRGRSTVIVFRAGGFRATRYCRFFENSEISALLEFALEDGSRLCQNFKKIVGYLERSLKGNNGISAPLSQFYLFFCFC